ncbi:MAG: DNA primase [Oscillospiraceae bacterium]
MAIPERFIDELVSRCDIVDVVSDYVQLTKKSGSNLFGLCPFHSEKTPSFSVSSDKQIYHCFGCGKGGGVISFIMEMESLSYPDAIAFLAKRAGMEMPEDDTPEEVRSRRTRLLELNKAAARFFYDNLSTPAGKSAVDYINKRGISAAMVKRFGLGAAPNEWNALSDAMMRKGFSVGELLDAGLVKKGRNGGVYDVFRNRLVFPVIDVRGSVIGFSGRILDDGEPKYLNSPDTPVFQKSRNLFALNLAKKTKRGMLILAEGNIDVVSLHQAGFDCAVASLGTSLTPDQARLMSRYTENVVISYDSDAAGVKAAQRAIGLLEQAGINVRVLRMEGAKDPDEFIKKNGPDAFSVLLDRSEDRIEYRLLAVRSKYDMETDDGRLGFLKEATELLSAIPNAIEREIYSRKVSESCGISAEAVQNEVKKAFKRRVAAGKKQQERQNLRPEMTAQPQGKSIRYENVASAAAEEGIICLLMTDPSLVKSAQQLKKEDFTAPFLGKIFESIRKRFENGDNITPALMAAELPPEEAAHLTAMLQRPISTANAAQALGDYIDKIRTERLKNLAGEDLLAVREKYKQKKGFGG